MMYKCPFCDIGKRSIGDIKKHILDMATKCFYWSLWINEK